MRAWISPQAMDIPSMFRRETVVESNLGRIVVIGFMGTVQKGHDTLGNKFTRMKGPII